MARTLTRALAVVATTLTLAACSETRTPTAGAADTLTAGGADTSAAGTPSLVLAVDSLWTTDGRQPPCCAKDSAGARVTILAGTLTLRRLAHFTDSVPTPGGWKSAACVHGVPNYSLVHRNGLVTLPDGSGYLLMRCDTGTFSLALTRRFDFAGDSTFTAVVELASGSYGSRRDTLRLWDDRVGASLATAISWDTIAVIAGGHALRFIAGPAD
jgi:hypothetical protein